MIFRILPQLMLLVIVGCSPAAPGGGVPSGECAAQENAEFFLGIEVDEQIQSEKKAIISISPPTSVTYRLLKSEGKQWVDVTTHESTRFFAIEPWRVAILEPGLISVSGLEDSEQIEPLSLFTVVFEHGEIDDYGVCQLLLEMELK